MKVALYADSVLGVYVAPAGAFEDVTVLSASDFYNSLTDLQSGIICCEDIDQRTFDKIYQEYGIRV